MSETSAVATVNQQDDYGEIMQSVVQGDLAKLGAGERAALVVRLCQSLGLNPATGPFQFLTLKGKTVLYARKDCTEQLRRRDNVSIEIVSREILADETYLVTARATIPGGKGRAARHDESIGAVSLKGLSGEDRSNQIMRCETKAKRRVTLSICGLGCLDESEVLDVRDAQPVQTEAKQVESKQAEQLPAPTQTVQQPTPQTGSPSPRMIADDQLVRVTVLAGELNIAEHALRARLLQLYSVNEPQKLTWAQAADLIGRLTLSKQKKIVAEAESKK